MLKSDQVMIFAAKPLLVTTCLNRKIVKFRENLSNANFVQKSLHGRTIVYCMFVLTLEKNLSNASFVKKGSRPNSNVTYMFVLTLEKNPTNASFVKKGLRRKSP